MHVTHSKPIKIDTDTRDLLQNLVKMAFFAQFPTVGSGSVEAYKLRQNFLQKYHLFYGIVYCCSEIYFFEIKRPSHVLQCFYLNTPHGCFDTKKLRVVLLYIF